MRAVVCGFIGTYPVGGVVWDYGQYVLALEALGYEVFYLEDSGQAVGSEGMATREAVHFLDTSLRELSPAMGDRWHFRDCEDVTYGMSPERLREVLSSAELFLNVSGSCLLRPEYADTERTVYLDTDPGWNHYDRFPRVDAWAAEHPDAPVLTYRAHDHHFTYATNLGQSGCSLPDMGLQWHPTRPPVATARWSPRPPGQRWTTVMSWNTYGAPLLHDGEVYGSKEMEFTQVETLPTNVNVDLEVAVDGRRAPVDRWRAQGWRSVDAITVSRDASSYRSYIEASRGEFSVAKNVYVATHSGWFSCRSTCYLASGRPVVVQDTGFGRVVPTGHGVLAFRDVSEAAAALEQVESDYAHHAEAARWVATTYFEGEVVLKEMLETMGMST